MKVELIHEDLYKVRVSDILTSQNDTRSSYKERRENDLASGAEEGRDKLR